MVTEIVGYEEGIIRIIIALEDSDHTIDLDALYRDERLMKSSAKLKRLTKKGFYAHQSRILQTDEDKAFKSLAKLITTSNNRKAP